MTSESIVKRRHPEWQQWSLRWRWLMDSLEGGEVYRQAIYGVDRRGLPIRNLVRHKREYPDPMESRDNQRGSYLGATASTVQAMAALASYGAAQDPTANATDDDYEMRRARTPVPTFVREAVETHLGKIYCKEVKRESPSKPLVDWWKDVTGKGMSIDEWMSEEFAPAFMVLGQLDVLFSPPPAPAGIEVRTLADQRSLGLDRCQVSIILPENILWWRLDDRGRYAEVLHRDMPEPRPGQPAKVVYRLVDAEKTVIYSEDDVILETIPHNFGRCPVVRILDRRRFRCRNVGFSRYESIAERMREYYNRDSELILSDTTQAHPLLQGPEDYVQADGSIPIGPSWLLPKKKNTTGGTSVSYEGFDVVDFPKEGADSLRKNKGDIRDDVDRDAGLTKPAGATGSTRGTVAQSGVSKQLDKVDGNDRLTQISRTLARAEKVLADYALSVLLGRNDVAAELDRVKIEYPTVFDLDSPTDLADALSSLQDLLERSGQAPEVEIILLDKLIRATLPGLDDLTYTRLQAELRARVGRKASMLAQGEEAAAAAFAISEGTDSDEMEDDPEDATQDDPQDEDPDETPDPPRSK